MAYIKERKDERKTNERSCEATKGSFKDARLTGCQD
jgi:hypothetical protein